MRRRLNCSLLIVATVSLLTACERKEPNIELIQDMMESPAIKAQDYDPTLPDQRANGLPPEGTIPRGFQPYTLTDSIDAERLLVNPVVGRDDLMPRGQKLFQTYCAVCHGPTGHGNGPIIEKWIAPIPSLVSTKIRGWKDGGIYHLIAAGRGLMGSYATQVTNVEDRWLIVNYIRHMQKNQPVFETPLTKPAPAGLEQPAGN